VVVHDGLEVVEFPDRSTLRTWLVANAATHPGVWVHLTGAGSDDGEAYLQRFTPRRTRGTASERNQRLVERLESEGRMTMTGYRALGMPVEPGS
jgi:uncharacterized protein YdeI (YjbR/CyaY-like superfamily)